MEAKKELKNGFGEFGVGSEFSLYPNNGVSTVLDLFQDLKKWCSKIQAGYRVKGKLSKQRPKWRSKMVLVNSAWVQNLVYTPTMV